MAANTSQGRSFGLFLAGLTGVCVGIGYWSTGIGKVVGALLACLGWVVVLVGLPLVTGTGGRIVLALGGIAVSLFGIIYVLPTAFNKNAIWKT